MIPQTDRFLQWEYLKSIIEGETMKEGEKTEKEGKDKIPAWQLFYDDIFLIFMLGMVIPLLSYIIWGLMDIARVPVAKP